MKKIVLILLVLCMIPAAGLCEEQEDYICAQQADSGGDVRIVLEMAYNLGFLTELADDEETYREEYVPAVQALEEALSLEADGVIRLSEIVAIDGLAYPEISGTGIAGILKKLANLGYIKDLPDDQMTYEEKYVKAVKDAEKKLDLTPDGYLTVEEQETILQQEPVKPDELKNLKVVSKDGKAVLSWSASKNAVRYSVRRDGVQIAAVKGTSFTDDTVEMARTYQYSVYPERYGEFGKTKSEEIYIEPVYKSIDINNLYENLDSYIATQAFVRISTNRTKNFSFTWAGDDIYFLFPYSGGKYVSLYCENYRNWTWTNGSSLLPHKAKDMSVTVKGRVIGTKRYGLRDVPVIDVWNFNYSYWN